MIRRDDESLTHKSLQIPNPQSQIPPANLDAASLPAVDCGERLPWDLKALYEALNAQCQERGLAWRDAAAQIRCSEHQLTGIRTAKYAIGMRLAMRTVVWLDRHAAAFVDAARW